MQLEDYDSYKTAEYHDFEFDNKVIIDDLGKEQVHKWIANYVSYMIDPNIISLSDWVNEQTRIIVELLLDLQDDSNLPF